MRLGLRELRQADPGGLAIIELLNEDDAADRRLLMRSLTFPGAVVASDAMPLTWTGPADPLAWPPAATAITHPRTAGTFSRAVRLLTRGDEPLSLADALSRCSLQPARLLEDRVPGHAPQGAAAGRSRRGRGDLPPGHAHGPGHLHRQHAPVGGHPARPGQRRLRGPRRLDRARRPARAAGARRAAMTVGGRPAHGLLTRRPAIRTKSYFDNSGFQIRSLLCSNIDMGVTGEEQVRGAPPDPAAASGGLWVRCPGQRPAGA